MSDSRGSAVLVVLILLFAVALAAGNAVVFGLSVRDMTGLAPDLPLAEAVRAAYERNPPFMLYYVVAPLGAGLILALVAGLRRSVATAPAAEAIPEAEEPAAPRHTSALRLLSILQQEGRLIDFLEEDIAPYSDAQVGAAVRSIHSGCRKTLHEHMSIDRIFAAEDGSEVEIDEGYDPATVRLTGNVHGKPPFRGILQHGGWRAADVELPEATAGLDPGVLAPAEVEIPE